jgi:phosphoglucosamine mutase
VTGAGADLGVAFDGDGDRMLAVDARGEVVDGDQILAILMLHLDVDLVAVTVMANLGLHRLAEEHGIRVVTTDVGDRYVLEALRREGGLLGGEQSGHIIFRDRATTGDGLLTGIELVRAVRAAGVPLSELASRIPRLPQVVINSAVRRRDDWRSDTEFVAAVERATQQMGERGRVLVRPSGTEAKIRIMVEGDDANEIDTIARELATLAEARLN